jgi:hypothetical protein
MSSSFTMKRYSHGDWTGDETYRLGGVCPADARYIHGTLVFCESGYGVSGDLWTNTAFGTIAYHEYAHHILESVYADRDEYCEGFADAYAVLIAGDPRYARGYIKNNCDSVLHHADNDCQYDPDTSTTNCGDYDNIYGCARLFSGVIWDLGEELRATHPTEYMDILMPLFIEQAKYHGYNGRIDPLILDIMLMLDDDDGDLNNGTLHGNEICSAFEAHGFDCPIAISRPCDGLCNNPVTFSWDGKYQSGDLQTGAVCRETMQNVSGGNCGNFASSRTLSVNGAVMTCNNQNWTGVPAMRNGGYCIHATAGDYPWAYYTLW